MRNGGTMSLGYPLIVRWKEKSLDLTILKKISDIEGFKPEKIPVYVVKKSTNNHKITDKKVKGIRNLVTSNKRKSLYFVDIPQITIIAALESQPRLMEKFLKKEVEFFQVDSKTDDIKEFSL